MVVPHLVKKLQTVMEILSSQSRPRLSSRYFRLRLPKNCGLPLRKSYLMEQVRQHMFLDTALPENRDFKQSSRRKDSRG